MSQSTLQHHRQGMDYGEGQRVQSLHTAIEPAETDGRITIKPFSPWVLIVFGVVFFFAGFFSARNGTHFTATSMDSGNPPLLLPTLPAIQPSADSASAVQSAVADANAPVIVHVVMKNMKFDPATLEIKKGDTVEWTNEDITPHTATALPFFDSGSLASDKSWKNTFTETGSLPYGCTFHPDMKGIVIVK